MTKKEEKIWDEAIDLCLEKIASYYTGNSDHDDELMNIESDILSLKRNYPDAPIEQKCEIPLVIKFKE